MPSPTTRRVLLASTALTSLLLATAFPAAADDATWLASPATGDFNTAANWSSGAVPTGTAFFGASSTTTLSFRNMNIGGITLNADAAAYTISSGGNRASLSFNGAGIVINGGSATFFNILVGTLSFTNSSTAGAATIKSEGSTLSFEDHSTAGTAVITGILPDNSWQGLFSGHSSADRATITLNGGFDNLAFSGNSTAAGATINAKGSIVFNDASTAEHATITLLTDGGAYGRSGTINKG